MRPLKIRLAGFAGIASGRAKEVVEIDFGAVDADAQIVALAGPNGAGKTTIMDNLHPYRVMPSRASSPTPGAFFLRSPCERGQRQGPGLGARRNQVPLGAEVQNHGQDAQAATILND